MILYTDGACSKNGSPEARASWAFLEQDNGEVIHEASGVVHEGYKQTNNVGELMAIWQAMIYAMEKEAEWCVIFSDSLYAINSITLWDIEKLVRGERKSNYKLIKACQRELVESSTNFQLLWVKGHSVDALNNRVDELAVKALKYGNHYARYTDLRVVDTTEPINRGGGDLVCSCGKEVH